MNLSTMTSRFTMVVAVHLILIKNGKILLARRFNTGYEDGNFSLPAGHVEAGESCLQAMVREAKEEIGLNLRQQNLSLGHVMERQTDRQSIDFFFVCEQWTGTPQIKEKDKCDLLAWYESTSLPANTIGYIRQAIESLSQGEKYSELGF